MFRPKKKNYEHCLHFYFSRVSYNRPQDIYEQTNIKTRWAGQSDQLLGDMLDYKVMADIYQMNTILNKGT